jgi:enolase-phosphatase E1
MPVPGGFRVALLDIEGTTTPVSFVQDVLFPYARERISAFVQAYAGEPEVSAAIQALRREHSAESGDDVPPPWRDADPGAYACWLIDRDRKSTPLKMLQGRIWEDAYKAGLLMAPIYDDVPKALARWTKNGREVAIFSSGSVLAQRLLFANTTAGDLTRFLSGYFDTTTGPKRDRASYERIAAARGKAPAEVLFVSDVPAELDAAREAGMRTSLCVRPEAAEPKPGAAFHPVVRSLDEVP